jgi:hypothetical protein
VALIMRPVLILLGVLVALDAATPLLEGKQHYPEARLLRKQQ